MTNTLHFGLFHTICSVLTDRTKASDTLQNIYCFIEKHHLSHLERRRTHSSQKTSCCWLFSKIRSAWLSKFSPLPVRASRLFYRFPSSSMDNGASGWTAGLHLKSMLISLRDTFASEEDLSHQSCVNRVSSSSRTADTEAESLAHFFLTINQENLRIRQRRSKCQSYQLVHQLSDWRRFVSKGKKWKPVVVLCS